MPTLNRAGGDLVSKVLRLLIVLASITVILLFFVTALRRMSYPYELEELEGNVFISALRVFHGQPLYPRPSFEFIPYMYPPLYFYAAAAMGKVMGMTIMTMRVTSILSTLGCFAMIYAMIFREVRTHLAALVAVGLYAGCYTLVGCWYDLGRLDSFFILLVLMAMYATRNFHPVVAAILWILCFETKQSILPAAFILLCTYWKDIRRTISGLLTLIFGCIGSVVWADHLTGGWYSFYVFKVPAANADIKARTLVVFLSQDIFRPLGLLVGAIFAAFILTRPNLRSQRTQFYLAACSLIPLFWWIRSHAGSTGNAVMPIYALLAILFGLSFARLEAWIKNLDPVWANWALPLLLFCVFIQNVAGIYNPGDYVPSLETTAGLSSLMGKLRHIQGEVYVEQHAYYALLAGKRTYADLISIHDAERVNSPVRAELKEEFQSALVGGQFRGVALDSNEALRLTDSLLGDRSNWQESYGRPVPLTDLSIPRSPVLLMPHQTDVLPTLSPGVR